MDALIKTEPNGKRGKMEKSDAHNLWEWLKAHESAVLLFAADASVSFTNNRAERDLRMSKVKKKSRDVLEKSFMLKLIAESQAICNRWQMAG